MTETFIALLKRLCELKPDRFDLYDDSEYGEEFVQFTDNVMKYTLKTTVHALPWLFNMLDELKIEALWKQPGRSWEESILNAIVHVHEAHRKEG